MQSNKRLVWFGTAVLAVCTFAFITGVASSPYSAALTQRYAAPLSFAFLGAALLFSGLGKTVDEKIGLGFLAWFVLGSVLRGDLWLENSYPALCSFVGVYAVALPAARLLGKKAMGTASAVAFVLPAALAAIAVLASMTVGAVYVPYIRTAAGITEEYGLRLQVGSHPNTAAGMFLIALLMGVWAACHFKRRWMWALFVPMALALYTATALAVSRTVMVQVAFAAALMAASALWNREGRLWVRLAVAGAGAAAAFAVVYMGFDAAVQVVSLLKIQIAQAETLVEKRSLLANLGTLTGRTDIYAEVFRIISDKPSILLTGIDAGQLMQRLNGPESRMMYTVYHTHNAYLQVLVCYGLPGLAMAVWFTLRAVWAAWHVLLSKCAFSDKLPAIIPLTLLPSAITEVYLFSDGMPLCNMVYFLCLGFAIEKTKELRAKA